MSRVWRFLILATFLPAIAGCAAAAGAAAGAAGAVAYNNRGVETNLTASVAEVEQATEAVFTELGIATTEREMSDGGDEVDLTGQAGDMRVHVEIEREEAGLTSVEVTAREGTLDYDRDYAEDVLRRIIEAT